MEFKVEVRDHAKIIYIFGNMDVHSIHKIEKIFLQEIQKNDSESIILDLENVPFVSSSGLRILVASLKFAKEQENKLFLTNLNPAVEKVFEIVDLNTMFHIRKTIEEAIS